MKPSTVILILILVALVILFVVGVALGTQQRSMPTRAQIESWAGSWFDPSPIRSADLRWDGGSGDASPLRRSIGEGKRATLHIAPSEEGQRKLTVVTEDELSLKLVRESVPDMGMKTRRDETNEVDFQVDDEGARIELTCRQGDGDACTVRIE